MGKSLIITEKPSVAREFANVLHVSGRQNGYIENQDYVITWCVGHLVGMVYPESYDIKYKKWRLEDLPFLPREYKYDVIKEVKGQYDIVHGMLQREDIDRVYWAGDAGKEGQTIEENIRNFGGVRDGMEELRVWIDSQTEEEILRGIREARPMSDYANLGRSGIMRTIEDYAMGINFSRVMSVKYGNLLNDAAGTKSYTAIAVGRVMTCVLGMVVIREREIRNFKETSFYRVIGRFTDGGIEGEWKAVEGSKYFESPLLYKENGFREEKDANALMEVLEGKPAHVLSIEKSTTKKRAPLLFNLAELQAECSKRFKISPDETLQVAQDLYEKKLTTYPRTDARVLSSAIAKEIYKNISKLRNYEPTHAFAEEILSKKLYANITNTSYTDDSKVTDHYAIIPTGQLTELNSLNSLQRAVFDVIVRRFLSIFYPPAEYENVKLVVGVACEDKTEQFFSGTKVLKKPGYLEVATLPKKKSFEEANARILGEQPFSEGDSESGEAGSPDGGSAEEGVHVNPKVLLELAEHLKKGDEVSVAGYGIKLGKTSPPKRYTSGSMVLAMENAGQLIEDEELREQIKGSGIGTSATRAEIIQKLVRIGYLNLNRKTQILSPENLGEMIYEVVNMTVPALLNPKMTASWEKGLDGITRGTVDFQEYRAKLEDFIRRETCSMIDQNIRSELAERISEFAGVGAKGAGARRKIGAKCPKCGGEIVTTPFGYGCANYKKDKSGCNFNIGEIAGVTIPEEQVKLLLGEEGRTGVIKGFKSKSGKRFNAALRLERAGDSAETADFDNPFLKNEQPEHAASAVPGQSETSAQPEPGVRLQSDVRIVFDFSAVEPEILPDVVCPSCGGQIRKTSFGFGCVNFRKEDENSCRFSIGQIAGKNLTASNVKQLLTEGRTDTIRGFKSKNKKKFDACLVLEKDEEGRPSIQFDFEHVEAKKIAGVVCPLCQGEIVATPFGFGCANYRKDDENSCRFSIGKMAEKSLTETQIKQLLGSGRTETIRGFKSKSGKKFDARVALAKDETGKVTGLKFDFDDVEPVTVKDVSCPLCGGKIAVTPFGYGCTNYKKDDESSCRFVIGKIAGLKLKEDQVRELLTRKKTSPINGFVAKTGMIFEAPLKLTEEGRVEFDFPEKPKPEESNVPCPKCGKLMKRAQWQYECECGFKLRHTVAQIPLLEETIIELVTTGKTRKKITGFTSKAGNVFDTCLKFEDDTIKFDFDNPGEALEHSAETVESPGGTQGEPAAPADTPQAQDNN
jgi:DNA topoisomerase-3